MLASMKYIKATTIFTLTYLVGATALSAQTPIDFVVKTKEVKANISPTMWGLFFEDINQGADGGLYAELIKNRSFEFDVPIMGWKVLEEGGSNGSYLILNRGNVNPANRRYVYLKSTSGRYGLSNEGFKGMGIKKDMIYNFSVSARQKEGSTASVFVELIDEKGQVIGSSSVQPQGSEWKKYNAEFKSSTTVDKANFRVLLKEKGEVDLDLFSLFPQDTWKNRKHGLRADMVQLLADMKPGFLRFPGGCIVEGRTLDERFQWKKTIGDPDNRELLVNRWNMEFKHRPAPDYFQSFGLGFFEYFQLCEDIGAAPLPILNAGMACQFNTAEVVPLDQLDPYIKDALDLIEFANGAPNSEWGKKRADMGHKAPFNMTMIGVGNENWGVQYIDRLTAFAKAIKAKYPNMKIVNSSGTDPNGERFDYLDKALRGMSADIIDEHYYRDPKWFLDNANRYDNYDRKGPKIFAGEYAAQSSKIASPDNKNNWQCAMSEAAFMTGLERNADVVIMASYAPLFAHIDGWQWTPDLIWVDNLRSYGTPNYQVQKLFSLNKGTEVVPLLYKNAAVSGEEGYYASASIDRKTQELILKVVNTTAKKQECSFKIDASSPLASSASLTVLSSRNLEEVNSFEHPDAISPLNSLVAVKNKTVKVSMKPYSVNVIRLKMEGHTK
jgi:alpha-N-arabinofuranosidase